MVKEELRPVCSPPRGKQMRSFQPLTQTARRRKILSNIVALPCSLDAAAREALVCVTTEWCSQGALTARVLARRADGATAVVFYTTELDEVVKLSPSSSCCESSFCFSFRFLDTPLFYELDTSCSDVSATLELDFDGAAQCVGRFSINEYVGCAKMWRDDLRMALQCVVPWARCQVPQRHALHAPCVAPASLGPPSATTTPHSASPAAVLSIPSVISRVLSFTDCSALAACACVCRVWRAAAADDSLWGFAAARAFPGLIASALPIGVTHKNALAAATRAVAIAARPHVEFVPVLTPNLRVLDDFSFAIDVWWTPSARLIGGANAAAAEEEIKEKDKAAPLCVFAATFPARDLVASPGAAPGAGDLGVTLQCGLGGEGESAAVRLLRNAARLSHPDTRIGQELSVRVTALRSDGTVAVAFTDIDFGNETLEFNDEGRLVGYFCSCGSPLFYMGQRPTKVELGGQLSLTFTDVPQNFAGDEAQQEEEGRHQTAVVASFSIGAWSAWPPVEINSDDLLWALEHTVPWVV